MKILILQLKRIGDLILTTPAIRCLREAYPNAHLALVADSSCRGLLEAIPVDECRIFERKGQWKGIFGFGPNAWVRTDLSAGHADFCLDFTGTDRSALLSTLSASRRRVTFERFRKKPLRKWLYTDFVNSSVRDRHTADHYTDLLRPLGIEREGVPLDLALPGHAATTAKAALAKAGVNEPYVVIHAGTARAEKYWLPERWARVIESLRTEQGLECVLTGSSDPAEQAHFAAIQASLQAPCPDLSGKTGLLELAAIIRGARLLCGVDTAAMHLADATGTPLVALFGPTNPFHWRPRHTRAIVLRSGVTGEFSPSQKGGPMQGIAAGQVIEAVRGLLPESRRMAEM